MKLTTEKIFTHPLGIMAAAAGATFLWGSAFPFVKLSYEELDIGKSDVFGQILFAGYRFTLAALLILLFMKLLGRPIGYQRGSLSKVGRIGLFQTLLQYVFFYYGMSGSTGVQGSIIAGTTSFFQILLAHFMYSGDRITMRKVAGLTVGFAGVILVGVSKGDLSIQFGAAELCLLLAMFFGGLGNVLSKKESEHLDILYMTAYQMLLGGIALLVIGACGAGLMPFSFTGKATWMLLYLAVLSALGFVLWNTVMKYNKVGSISMYLFLIPVFGVFLSAALLGEELHLFVWAALALVVGGIVIVNRPAARKASPSQG
ncbi:DMT family transporter [Cohnella endophytica]|uniref:DMT family transporter n=1 Tax=Cohnella endophytica TaxID=2419778 RepID=A0A494XYH5_9BACL|nr:DMT family transporter [Cohnella endophytica]RKP54079.1 DMT family transporter [Cohnella endophytica]